ncbi:phage adaptor protein [Pseudogemmobacter sonorensis]|uniref:phage adaptor protein n=1 Tax=Pseudogemmobacter sonorensis TaxID=2989681 RepID=UPI0036897610
MARTILEIAQEAAERDATAPAPEKLFDTDNKVSKILRRAASDTMREFLAKTGTVGTSEFQSTWAFTLVPRRYAYPLPPDFLRVIPDTEHRGGWPLGLIGPANPRSWANWLHGGAAAPASMGWRIRNNLIWFEPVPAAMELVTIEYISRYPVVSGIKAGDYDASQTPPICTAPFVPRDGHIDLAAPVAPTVENQGEYDAPPGYDIAVWGPETFEELRRISVTSGIAPLPQVRRPQFTADDDLPAFEDDHPLSLGMTFRLRRALGLDYAEIAAEYEAEIEAKVAADAGGGRAFRLGVDCGSAAVAPLGDGRWLVS